MLPLYYYYRHFATPSVRLFDKNKKEKYDCSLSTNTVPRTLSIDVRCWYDWGYIAGRASRPKSFDTIGLGRQKLLYKKTPPPKWVEVVRCTCSSTQVYIYTFTLSFICAAFIPSRWTLGFHFIDRERLICTNPTSLHPYGLVGVIGFLAKPV
jgi:hypothetical protein